MTTSSDNELDKILIGTYSYDIYKELNNEVNENRFDQYCISFKKEGDNTEQARYDFCKKISRNTYILSKFHNTVHFTTLCSHYKYWAYYNINKILKDITDNNSAKPLVKKFLQVRDNIIRDFNAYYCQYNFNHDILQELNDMKEEKYLHDYFKNYDIIKTSNSCSRVTPLVYEKYLNYIITLYDKRKKENVCCSGPFLIDCDNYFKCDDEFDPKKLLSTLNSNGNKKCDNLIEAQESLTSNNASHTGSSLINITDSIYYFRCIDFREDKINDINHGDGKIRCHIFRTSDKSVNNPLSPSLQHPSVQVPFTTSGQRGFSASAELPREDLELNEHIRKQKQLSSSPLSHVSPDNGSDKNSPCPNPLLVRDTLGNCREPNVRETDTIGVKLNLYAPGGKIKIRLNHNSSMLKNNFFRVGIAFTLIVGIILTIFLYHKFTPFGRCFHKKVSRKKRIDDYYEDPYIRKFIIHAPKSAKRRSGNRGMQFSYYSR
ncbi:PIR Superfamily Protein [Plasmodium malariae]|uniref:PIR Superfamily Protein n=1 Tax=Plasmodium malariae TaxID=5858 RepID=A0A1A8X8M7_PLAMA|nr:PIR Superfamily Protein [Plasmodium malariae]